MAKIEIILPAMGEGIIEAEIIRWLVGEGGLAEKEQAVVEIATDKVDSEVPSPARGIIQKILLKEGETAQVGQVLAVLETDEPGITESAEPMEKIPSIKSIYEPVLLQDTQPSTLLATTSPAVQIPQSSAPGTAVSATPGTIIPTEPGIAASVSPGTTLSGEQGTTTAATPRTTIPVEPGSAASATIRMTIPMEPGSAASASSAAPGAAGPDELTGAGPAPMSTIRLAVLAFCSPAVRTLIREQGLTGEEIAAIHGSGEKGRLTLSDVREYLRAHPHPDTVKTKAYDTGTGKVQDLMTSKFQDGGTQKALDPLTPKVQDTGTAGHPVTPIPFQPDRLIPEETIYGGPENMVEEMDRMRKIIARHMVYSKQVSPHVSSFIETDVTELVYARERIRESFEKKFREKLTFTPFIIEAVARAIREYPRINISVDKETIILKQKINIGIAVALPGGNLIVPVIKEADTLSFPALVARVNDLSTRARNNDLRPDEIKGGTFTVTNLGNFGSLTGTPIINQPEAAILAVGTIRKKPAVITSPAGDAIGIRHLMILSLAYDHRVIDGALGGMFLKRISDQLEQFKEVPI